MIIKVDKEGREALNQLVDVALKYGGIQNLNGVIAVLQKIEPVEEAPAKLPKEVKK